MLVLLSILMFAIGISNLVCFILTEIHIFKESVGLGIVGILTCGIFALVYGWVKCNTYNNKKVMTLWSIGVGISILIQIISVVTGAAMGSHQMQMMN